MNLKIEPVFLNDFKGKTQAEIFCEFAGTRWDYESKENLMKSLDENESYKEIKILFASYGYENYSGDAYCLFEKNGELFEVAGVHCSCYGLEGQWEPKSVTIEQLNLRTSDSSSFGNDDYSGNEFRNEFLNFMKDFNNQKGDN